MKRGAQLFPKTILCSHQFVEGRVFLSFTCVMSLSSQDARDNHSPSRTCRLRQCLQLITWKQIATHFATPWWMLSAETLERVERSSTWRGYLELDIKQATQAAHREGFSSDNGVAAQIVSYIEFVWRIVC